MLMAPASTYISKMNEQLQIIDGVMYSNFTLYGKDNSKQYVSILKLDPISPNFDVRFVSAKEGITKRHTITEFVNMYDKPGHRVIAAVNGDYFDIERGFPTGTQITDGTIFTSSFQGSTQLAVMPDRSLSVGPHMPVALTLTAETGKSVRLTYVNKMRSQPDELVLFTPHFGHSTMTDGAGIEVLMRPACSRTLPAELPPGKPIEATVQAFLTTPNMPIPSEKFVLSASGTKLAWVKKHLSIGCKVTVQADYGESLNRACHVISSNTARVLLHKGRLQLSAQDRCNPTRAPRTIAAQKNDNKLYLMINDGRQPGYSDGMSLLEAASFLQANGFVEAINLDGGGSTAMVIKKPHIGGFTLVNKPSDGEERELSNAILITAKQVGKI